MRSSGDSDQADCGKVNDTSIDSVDQYLYIINAIATKAGSKSVAEWGLESYERP